MNPTINVDVRNKYYSISFDWDEVVIIEDEKRTESIANFLEQKYQTRLPFKIDKIVNKIFKSTDPENKDFWRNWTITKLIDIKENQDES